MTGRDGDWRLALAFGIVGAIAYTCTPSLAQITPDATLGAESSVITPNANVGGFPADLIQGGATRGANLFHSFSEFNIGNGQQVYFANPAGIETILTRVTGNNLSNILGTLGVNGRADLFLLNPNGILFGENARLDVRGSFVATTANAIQFGEQGFWSATNPEVPGLLTINPSAFFFNQLAAGTIINQSVSRNPIFPYLIDGLRVPIGENLVLLGGNVSIDGGRLNAFGGRVEIGAVAGTGTVGLTVDGSLSFPTDIPRADVSLFNSVISVFADNGGSVAINARNLDISGNSLIRAGILSGFGTVDSQARDISLNATGTLQIKRSRIVNPVFTDAIGNSGDIHITAGSLFLTDGAQLDATTFGQGNGGNILIEAGDRVSLDNRAGIFNNVGDTGNGIGGNIRITTGSLSVANGAFINSSVDGQGNAGDILIEASDRVFLDNNVRILNGVQDEGIGNGGDIRITTRSLDATNDAFMAAFTFGQGNAGNLIIEASDRVSLDNGAEINNFGKQGNGGDIRITTGRLSIDNSARLDTPTFGQGNAGNVIIEARDQVSLTNNASIANRVGDSAPDNDQERATGNGGDIQIRAGSLSVTNALIDATTYEQGNAGHIFVDVRDQVFLNNGTITNQVAKQATGNGGSIRISTGSLTATNLGRVQALTIGQGNAGNVVINARDRILFEGGIVDGFRSGAVSAVGEGAVGNGGNIEITTGSLDMLNEAGIVANTFDQGNAGNVIINARDNVSLDNSNIFSTVDENAVGRGGNISITTGSLALANSAQLDASTFGQGSSGNIIINARDAVSLDGINPFRNRTTTIFTEVVKGSQGDGGNIEISTGSLFITNGAKLEASTRGTGNAGNIFINARDLVSFDGANTVTPSGAFSGVEADAIGRGGNIQIATSSLAVRNGAQLGANTAGWGAAGNIQIEAGDRVFIDGAYVKLLGDARDFGIDGSGPLYGVSPSAIRSDVERGGSGNGGDIYITAGSLSISNGAQIDANTAGQGDAGNIQIDARDTVLLDGVNSITDFSSGLFSSTFRGAGGRGGTIRVNTDSLSIANGAIVNAQTLGAFRGGDVTINTRNLSLSDRAQISASSQGTGNAGGVAITADEAVTLSNSDITTSAERASGGAISITTDSLSLNQGRITAATGTTGAQGAANISLQGLDLLLMGKESLISANALNQANGGNVAIDSTIIVATPPEGSEGSDISANAFQGNGGRVNITTQGLFGIEFRPQRTPDNDITVSSEFGIAGEFALNQPDIDLSRGLAELPSNLVDAENQLDRTCSSGGAATRSSFVVTGRGGIPPAPTDPLDSPAIVSQWVTLDAEEQGINNVAPDANPTNTASKAIVEAQGWVQTPDGQVILVAQAPSTTPHNSWLTSPSCQDLTSNSFAN